MKFILALDQGTTSSRALLFDRMGEVRAVAQQELTQHFPQPGWVEHDPEEIFATQLSCARRVLAEAGIAASEVAAAGITNQRETTVLWDRAGGAALAPAIVWQDRRTAARCDELRAAGHAAMLRQKTGLEIDAYFSASKLEWLLGHIPQARRRAEQGELAFGTIDSWLAWKLTGAHVTDASNASRTQLFDLALGDWDEALLELFRIPRALLPRVVDSSGIVATIDAQWLGAPIPLAAMAGDQQAATFGQACFSRGLTKNTYGTGCFMCSNTGRTPLVSNNRLLSTVGWRIGGDTEYLLEGSIFAAGATIQWLRDGLGIIGSTDEVEPLARSVADSGGVVLVPAFVGLGAPHWDAYARAALHGMTRGTGRAHIVRAALEAICCQSVDLLQAMHGDIGGENGGDAITELHVDGGAARNDLLMQMQADLAGIPVLRPQVTETTARGAAFLAGLAVGYWSGLDELAALWRIERKFDPAIGDDERGARMALWQRGVERSLGWVG